MKGRVFTAIAVISWLQMITNVLVGVWFHKWEFVVTGIILFFGINVSALIVKRRLDEESK